MEVKAWEELVKIPTYKIGTPDKNPMFLEKRIYQGSSGVVYPHPVIDKVFDEKEDKNWTALYLENEYLKIMILPELGGRIQMAYDKTNDYHFIYYNSVIKPALVGLAGPWISGGIEFNWPQHHRPSTFDAIDFTIVENKDGSKTVWVNEYEKMFRTKCALGFTLYPDKAYIELHAKLYNRTDFPQTFLWWANPAVAVDEHYQSVFPPDVHAVFDHGKRDVSTFPIATGTYYKVDYSPGTDISRYSNIPVPTSYMAVNSEFNFVGGYHHKKSAGMMHIADHNISPGKKQWTWGCGEFGKAWDRQLTDTDGPYFELMCGVFTDNQPDFSWIMPNEAREFKQYFMPYKEIGYVKNASIEAMVNFEINGDIANMGVYVTAKRNVKIVLLKNGLEIYSKTTLLSPTITFSESIQLLSPVLDAENYSIEIFDDSERVLIDYKPVTKKDIPIPDPAKPILSPGELLSNEDLYLAGYHLEQYRHATYSAENYYLEAIKRDSSDIRNNNALGLLYLKKGEYIRSEAYFRNAIEKLNKHNPNPYDSEPIYNLGLTLKYQKRFNEAYSFFYKSAWNAAMQDNAYLQLAFIEAIGKNWNNALLLVEKSIVKNCHSLKARHLKAVILYNLSKYDVAIEWAEESLCIDHFDFGSRYELYKSLLALGEADKATVVIKDLQKLMRDYSHNYIELSIDYANGGGFTEAFELLSLIADSENDPLVFYYLGYYSLLNGDIELAKKWFHKGFKCSPEKVFPNRLEDIEVLQKVTEINPMDYKALYYMGNFYYAKRRYSDARICWEKSIAIYDKFPTTLRNLGIAYFNKFNLKDKSLESFEKSFCCDETDSRVLFELDQLYKQFNKSPKERLAFLENHKLLVAERDDLYLEYILLHSLTGQYEQATKLLAARNFHPWEGGEGKVTGQFLICHIEQAKEAFYNKRFEEALVLLNELEKYPESLGEGKLYNTPENDIDFFKGCVWGKLGMKKESNNFFEKASSGETLPAQAIFYNDPQPDKIFYRGLALLKLGKEALANAVFNQLIDFGEHHLKDEIKIDYFAVSLPDLSIFDIDLNLRNFIHCKYMIALGELGKGNLHKANELLLEVQALDACHQGAHIHLGILKNMDNYK